MIDIRTGVIVVGDMKSSDLKIVKEWVTENKDILLEMWSQKGR